MCVCVYVCMCVCVYVGTSVCIHILQHRQRTLHIVHLAMRVNVYACVCVYVCMYVYVYVYMR